MASPRKTIFETLNKWFNPNKEEPLPQPVPVPERPVVVPKEHKALTPRTESLFQQQGTNLYPHLGEVWELNGEKVEGGYLFNGIFKPDDNQYNFNYQDYPQLVNNAQVVVKYRPSELLTNNQGLTTELPPKYELNRFALADIKGSKEEVSVDDEALQSEYNSIMQTPEGWRSAGFSDPNTAKDISFEDWKRLKLDNSINEKALWLGSVSDYSNNDLPFVRGSKLIANKYGLDDIVITNPENLRAVDEALSTLANTLKIPTQMLGLPFEMKGVDGPARLIMFPDLDSKHNFGAYYRPDSKLVNNKPYVNALAHEWAHTFDNYIANAYTLGTGKAFTTEIPEDAYLMRKELKDVFTVLHKYLQNNTTNFTKASLRKDDTRIDPYWSTPREMFARTFESWISSKVGLTKFLVDDPDKYKDIIYPQGEEKEQLFAILDDMFSKIKVQEVTGKDGSVFPMFYTIAPIAIGGTIIGTSDTEASEEPKEDIPLQFKYLFSPKARNNITSETQQADIPLQFKYLFAPKKRQQVHGGTTIMGGNEDASFERIVQAVAKQESNNNDPKFLESSEGALGYMQLMPDTAKEIAQKLGIEYDATRLKNDKEYNMIFGKFYLKDQLKKWKSLPIALAAYNGGPGNVQRWLKKFGDPRKGEIDINEWLDKLPTDRPGFRETRDYVRKIMANL